MTEELVKKTQDFFKEKYGKELSEAEAQDINRRITTYFRLLHRWKKRQLADSSTENKSDKVPE